MKKKSAKKSIQVKKKKQSGLFKLLEVVVLIGTLAGLLMKVFKGKQK